MTTIVFRRIFLIGLFLFVLTQKIKIVYAFYELWKRQIKRKENAGQRIVRKVLR